MSNQITHFARIGQIIAIRRYFPSEASYTAMITSAYNDHDLQRLREAQMKRNVDSLVKREYPPNTLTEN